jgi:hypothetical protein
MSVTLSQLSIPAFVRGLTILSTLLAKGEAHAVADGIAPDTLLGARLAPDMLPLAAQVQRASGSPSSRRSASAAATPPNSTIPRRRSRSCMSASPLRSPTCRAPTRRRSTPAARAKCG